MFTENKYKKLKTDETVPYTYAVGWTHLDRWYYGVSYRRGCNPGELWSTYFTSSKSVQEFRRTYGEPDVIKVRKTFIVSEDAIKWEQKVLKKLKIFRNERWLNKGIGMPSFKGLRHSEN